MVVSLRVHISVIDSYITEFKLLHFCVIESMLDHLRSLSLLLRFGSHLFQVLVIFECVLNIMVYRDIWQLYILAIDDWLLLLDCKVFVLTRINLWCRLSLLHSYLVTEFDISEGKLVFLSLVGRLHRNLLRFFFTSFLNLQNWFLSNNFVTNVLEECTLNTTANLSYSFKLTFAEANISRFLFEAAINSLTLVYLSRHGVIYALDRISRTYNIRRTLNPLFLLRLLDHFMIVSLIF